MVSQKEENMLSNQWANLALRNQNDSGLPQGPFGRFRCILTAVSWHSGFRGGAHARRKTTPVHHAPRRCGCCVAARGARAAAGDAGDRIPASRVARTLRAHCRRFSARLEQCPLLRLLTAANGTCATSQERGSTSAFGGKPENIC